MVNRRRTTSHKPSASDDTREHILAAGRELMLAAKGALSFINSYMESQKSSSSQDQISSFFHRAISVADQIGRELSNICPKPSHTSAAIKPIIEALASEMKASDKFRPRPKRPRSKTKGKRSSR